MNISAAGIKLIESFEGVRLTGYQDIKGILTIGVGYTGKDVHPGLVITQDQANDLLQMDLRMTEAAVSHLVKVPLIQCQFDSLVSFTFNVGAGNLATSTLLRDLNQGNVTDADKQFVCLDHAGVLRWMASVRDGLLRPRCSGERCRRRDR
jgi:lysozyme